MVHSLTRWDSWWQVLGNVVMGLFAIFTLVRFVRRTSRDRRLRLHDLLLLPIVAVNGVVIPVGSMLWWLFEPRTSPDPAGEV